MTNSTIAAISTPPGIGGIAIIRLSGPDAFSIADKVWKGKRLSEASSHTAHLGIITDTDGETLDQAIATVYAEGKSFTGEKTVEFAIHGSKWIQRRVVERLIEEGASTASPGEFTQRAFLNGRLDLAQAEAVADMIAASSKAAQRLAVSQMRGTFSRRLNELRDSMIEIASLLELELDFSEEDVEFADRTRLLHMTCTTRDEIRLLADSFKAGRALKEGVAVVIAGKPNAGKSTLLNCLLQDEKAIVSDIAGTTRDIIEDTIEINGILFRFIDTAGLRDSDDRIEQIGVNRARQAIEKADIILHLIDTTEPATDSDSEMTGLPTSIPVITLLTKSDLIKSNPSTSAASPESGNEISATDRVSRTTSTPQESVLTASAAEQHGLTLSATQLTDTINDPISISAKTGEGIPELIDLMTKIAESGRDTTSDLIVTNARHYESLTRAAEALDRVEQSLTSGLPADLTAQDLREAIHHLGAITGAITPADLLHSIFSHFCIGK
ncbi:MAG: tRNA uridine-5-carboxymethylaminomethyl(34) synthesis GTPase MnmE [Muribaculaceae bacterium]|nr:tRNA uridine-5-carboxymethylaminomethyl(34) synthesis GTPase MnmE [Muribaculaceae bacterium]